MVSKVEIVQSDLIKFVCMSRSEVFRFEVVKLVVKVVKRRLKKCFRFEI